MGKNTLFMIILLTFLTGCSGSQMIKKCPDWFNPENVPFSDVPEKKPSREEQNYMKVEIMKYNYMINNNPNDSGSFHNRAIMKVSMGDIKGAIEDVKECDRLKPDHPPTLYTLGTMLYQAGDYPAAKKTLDRVLEINPEYAYAYDTRAMVKCKMNDLEGAIEDYTKMIELVPDSEKAYANRGVYKMRLCDTEGAISDYMKVLELNPEVPAVLCNLSEAKYFMGFYSEAREYADKSIKQLPENSESYFYRGMSSIRLGDEVPGLDDLRKAAGMGYTRADLELKKIGENKQQIIEK